MTALMIWVCLGFAECLLIGEGLNMLIAFLSRVCLPHYFGMTTGRFSMRYALVFVGRTLVGFSLWILSDIFLRYVDWVRRSCLLFSPLFSYPYWVIAGLMRISAHYWFMLIHQAVIKMSSTVLCVFIISVGSSVLFRISAFTYFMLRFLPSF